MENALYNDLVRRGYDVDVGVIEKNGKNQEGKSYRQNLEIDFVVNRGDKRYYIEFKEDGSFSGRIKDLNDFSGSYTLPFVGKRAYYQDIEHGVINMSDWKVTDVNDNDPVSKQFMRMSKATQFKPVWPYYLILYVSSKEYFMFRTAQ